MLESELKKHLYALIIVGGGGTRLWPKSRNSTPKQFLKLFKGKTLAQITSERLQKFIAPERIFVVTTTEEYKKEFIREVPFIKPENVIDEPLRRNTAPAHGLGAIYIHKKDPEAVIINAYSDQLVDPEHEYIKNIETAAFAAFSGDWLVAVGVKPTYPNPGYGHIKKGGKWRVFQRKTLYKVNRFTEKPALELAKRYTASGEYFWNAGQYVWRADSFLRALERFEPSIFKGLQRIGQAINTPEERKVMLYEYKKMPEISVDYAVSERAKNFVMLVADFHWIDVGDWKEVWENLPKDDQGNVIIDGAQKGGEVINIDTSDALIHTDGRVIAVIDVDNVVIVDTKEALLVCAKSKAQNVKKIVEELKRKGRKELL